MHSSFKLYAVIILLLALTISSFAQTNNGLLAWYKFDASSGTSAVDNSGNNNTGTSSGAPGWVTGKYGNALNFVAASSQYVASPNLGNPQSVSIAAWVKSGAAGGVVFDENGTATPNGAWHETQIEIEASGIVWACVWIGSISCVKATNSIGFNQWHYLAMTYNVANHTLSGYYDGKLGASSVVTKQYVSTGNLFYLLGTTDTTNNGNGNYFTGIIDEARIYNRALTATEIYELFEGGGQTHTSTYF